MEIEYIFIDTNIFVSENFLEGHYIKKILEFGKKNQIGIISTKTNVNEIKNQFRKKVSESLAGYKSYMNSGSAKYLRNTKFGQKVNDYKFSKIKVEDLCEEFNKKIDEKLESSNVIILPFQNIDSSIILESYFESKPPFSNKKDKKLGFPDAFIIENLKKWVSENDTKLVVLTGDSDFSHLEELFVDKFEIATDIKEKYNSIVNSIQIHEKKLTEERLETLDKVYNSVSVDIEQEIKEYFKEGILDDESFYYEYTTENIYDISNLKFINIINHGYSIKKIHNEEEIEIEVLIDIEFSIDVLTDDLDSWTYDSDNKVVFYREIGTIIFEGKIELALETMMYIIGKDEYEDIIDFDITPDSYKISISDPNSFF